MNFIWLEDFLALAQTGHFSRAAENRCSSQPAFSRRIRSLEEWLGTDLVDRSSQPARLTAAGEWFKGVAENMVGQIARLPDEAKQVAETQAATLRIASTHGLSFVFLPRWLRQIESWVAMERVELLSDVLSRCEVLMQQGKVHFVLTHAHPRATSPLDAEHYAALKIGTDELMAVSRPNDRGLPLHALAADKNSTTSILGYTHESGLGRIFEAVMGQRLKTVPTQVVFKAHLASVLRTMALDGRGLAWLPKTLVEEDLDAGRLVSACHGEWNVPLDIRLYREKNMTGQAPQALWRAAASGH
jgi:LysR family transcriptional regulator, hypochlorite-specific transcription factor HypT